ncbi:MAG: lipid-A-disaccharide synthase [Candidatus Obscuribacterales bacterium]|nr:lipid-A-disaccharide synthase [Candidatus Obscuribacterales bacterium]
MSQTKSLFICVGDLSADRHAAKLIENLKKIAPNLEIWGVGGAQMEAAGVRLLYNRESLAVIGLVEVIRYLPKLISMRNDLIKQICQKKPDAVLLMDFGGFNLRLAQDLHRKSKDTPIIYFISPQVWGSRPWRINIIKKTIHKMLVIFPFEEALYHSHGMDAKFVGHPVTLKIKPESERSSKEDFCQQNNLDPAKPIIGIFPGSRNQEIRQHAPIIFQAIGWLQKERPDFQFVISATNQNFADALYSEMDRLSYNHLLSGKLRILSSEFNEELMAHADLLWTKSGTISLEAAVIGTPTLIFYHGSWITLIIFVFLKTVKWVGWPNLLAGYELVPELIQLDCRAEQLVRYTLDWMNVPALRKEVALKLKSLRDRLGKEDFTETAAQEVLKMLGLQEFSRE